MHGCVGCGELWRVRDGDVRVRECTGGTLRAVGGLVMVDDLATHLSL